jgi:signal transduction histidine kinase
MTVNYPHFNKRPSSPRLNSVAEQLGRLQTELISDALRRAVEDATAAMKHQLSEPLTALLLYLHEIKRTGELDAAGSAPAALSGIVDRAFCEIERVCNIIEQVGRAVGGVGGHRSRYYEWPWRDRVVALEQPCQDRRHGIAGSACQYASADATRAGSARADHRRMFQQGRRLSAWNQHPDLRVASRPSDGKAWGQKRSRSDP